MFIARHSYAYFWPIILLLIITHYFIYGEGREEKMNAKQQSNNLRHTRPTHTKNNS